MDPKHIILLTFACLCIVLFVCLFGFVCSFVCFGLLYVLFVCFFVWFCLFVCLFAFVPQTVLALWGSYLFPKALAEYPEFPVPK